MVFGSHLYGTDTPQSDHDFKGIYMPSREDILLGRIRKSIRDSPSDNTKHNTVGDIDIETYSLHYFVKLACEGQTVALDMLHADEDAIIDSSYIWDDLVRERSRFYTRDLTALVGYARRQASKYGIKGSRLADAKRVLHTLRAVDPMTRLEDIAPLWIGSEHVRMVKKGDDVFLQVCGKLLQGRARAKHYVPVMEAFVEQYGSRAIDAESNKGVDWKAMSHALRAGYQVKAILLHGEFTYPLPHTPILRRVKAGELDYILVAGMLESLLDELEELRLKSELPKSVDREWWDEWIMNAIETSGVLNKGVA
jgi:hypothetical protein